MFPIGLYVYFGKEKKDKIAYQKVFDDFHEKTLANKHLSDEEKLKKFEQMLEQNAYEVIEVTEQRVVAQKKVLSMGLMMMGLGLYIVGIFIYLLYFYTLQKPHKVVFELSF
jgi:cytochrome b subunit of formate dehydrogenase